MKKLLIITSLLVTSVSCINEKNEAFEAVKAQAPSLYCSTENNPLTRTSISVDEEGIGTIYWKPADCINVFFGTEKLKYYSTNEDAATNVIFDATEGVDGALADFSNIWGLYPYNAAATSDGLSVTTTIPASQQCIDNSFDTDLFPMLAHSASNELHFNNICGGIKFSLTRDDIKTITFKGNNDEDIVGKVKIIMDENGKPLASIESGEKVITLTPKSGDTFNSGAYYYIVILPCSLTDGFTMTFGTDEEIGTFNYNEKTISIKRSVFSKKENIDSYASFKVIIPDGVVDMGLSVMWATCNLGATTPEGYGDYYAWGETETKSDYTWKNYKWCEGTSTTLTKYNSNSSYGLVDNKTTLDLEDDVAYVKLGGRWRTPSPQEVLELLANSTCTDITSKGVKGVQYTSKKNGNCIFIPKAGRYRYAGSDMICWTTHLYSEGTKSAFAQYAYGMTYFERYNGIPIRPVFHSNEECEMPENPTDGIIDLGLSVRWRSCNLLADSPEEYGQYYVQGTYDAATSVLGESWRKPTYDECQELINNCTWTRTCVNGVGGYKIQSKVDGFTDKWIFLPAAGYKKSIEIYYDGQICAYWPSYSSGSNSTKALYDGKMKEFTTSYYLPIRPVSPPPVAVTGVSLQSSASMDIGETRTLIASVEPDDATDKTVTWTSDNTSVATVDSSGKVTAIAAGTAIITVTTVDGGFTASCTVTVRDILFGAVTGVSLKEWAYMEVGETRTLIASVEPDYATDKTVTWTSDNTSVATVDSSGKVTAIARGTAIITVKTVDGGFTASCTVTVRDIPSGAVDLDLPSGLLWASCNIGASYCTQYGNYYAWGEIETKSSYTGQNYRFHLGGNSAFPTYSKYVTNSDAGTVDNLTELQRGENPGETMDDVARAVLGGKWRMPRPEEFEELIKNTDNAYTEYNGVNGWMFTSKTDSEDWIFLPAAGYWGDSGKVLVGSLGALLGCYWSSVCDGYWDGKMLSFHSPYKSETWVGLSSNYRWCGQPVRPVIEW